MMLATLVCAALLGAPAPFAMLPAPPAGLPPATRMELPNGLRVVLVEDRTSPFLTVELAFAIGAGADPEDQIGLASIAGRMLTGGAAGLDDAGFARALARVGAHLFVGVERDLLTVLGSLPALDDADVRRFLALFVAAVRHPTLAPDVLQRELTQRQAQLESLQDAPGALADLAVRLAVLGDGPAGWSTEGTLATLPHITTEVVHRWCARALVPAHAVLVVAGAFERAPLAAWIAENFGDPAWGAGVTCTPGAFPGACAALCLAGDCLANPSAAPRPAFEPPSEAVYVTTLDEGAAQVAWRVGVANPISAASPDYAALRLGLHVLGGDFTARMNTRLRVREALTYGAFVEPDFGAHESGLITLASDATPANLRRALTLARAEFAAITASPIPAAELEPWRRALVAGFPFRFETVATTANQYLYTEVARLPLAWLADWRAALTRPSAAEVQAALARTVPPEKLVWVAVGPARYAPLLSAAGTTLRVVSAADLLASGLRAAHAVPAGNPPTQRTAPR